MTQLRQVYKCGVCGNMVEVVHAADGELVCCKQPMLLVAENSTDAATEKHVPVIEKTDAGVKVTVGSVAHPMVDDHYIEWIELLVGKQVLRKELVPGNEPVGVFDWVTSDSVAARAYCNQHGLWKG